MSIILIILLVQPDFLFNVLELGIDRRLRVQPVLMNCILSQVIRYFLVMGPLVERVC